MRFLLALMAFGKKHNITFMVITDAKRNVVDITATYLDVHKEELRTAEVPLDADVLRDEKLYDAILIAIFDKLCKELDIDPDEDEEALLKKMEEEENAEQRSCSES